MAKQRVMTMFWTICVACSGAVLLYLSFQKEPPDLTGMHRGALFFGVLLTLGFLAEYVDSSLGMGYGTTLTPILLILGFNPLVIVPAVLFSEFVSGLSAGLAHHHLGNVNLHHRDRSGKVMWLLAACSIVGTVLAVLLAVTLPKIWVKAYIGGMITLIGLFILFGGRLLGKFSYGKIVGLGVVAAFNKGISGGGYGPLVTGGQVMLGVEEKKAVGITSFAEGLVCLVGLILYFILEGGLEWLIALPLAAGAWLSVPAAAYTVKILPTVLLRRMIGYATVFLGALTLVKVVL